MNIDTQLLAEAFIESPDIAIVSFDFFDTLFFRPGFQPSDLFYLLERPAIELLKIAHFADIRGAAEAEMSQQCGGDAPYLNLHKLEDIYRHIAKRYNIDEGKCLELCKFELSLERATLRPRMDVRRLYERALQLNKRVIVVSDAYFTGSFLQDILSDSSFNNIAQVYVSNECGARKDIGDLFVHVLEREGVKAHQLVHIGDNFHSDIDMAMAAGIVGIHCPSILESLIEKPGLWSHALADRSSLDPVARLLIGLAINEWFSQHPAEESSSLFEENLCLFGFLGLGPVLFHTAHEIAISKDIQESYPSVCFASRDGYLPKRAYDLLSEGSQNIPSQYIYCGRAAYDSHRYNGDPAAFLSQQTFRAQEYSIRSLLKYLVSTKNKELYDKLVSAFEPRELETPYLENGPAIARVCNLYDSELKAFFSKERELASKYYSTAISKNDSDHAIIFDVGYGGSVSRAIGALTGITVDKIYMSGNDENEKSDQEHGTTTYHLIQDPTELTRDVSGMFLIFEELFSPAEPSCIGFEDRGEIVPIFERTETFTSQMRDDLASIHDSALAFVSLTKETFGPFAQYLSVTSAQHLLRPAQFAFSRSPVCEERMFSNILFADLFFLNSNRSLSTKIKPYHEYGNLPDHSGFNDPSRFVFARRPTPDTNVKIGVHLYLDSRKFLQPVLMAISQIPIRFDLFITLSDATLSTMANAMLRAMRLPMLGKATVKTTSESGSIGSWIASADTDMSDYDLVCHVGLVSPDGYSAMTTGWLEHLLRAMFAPSSISGIVSCFTDDAKLGVAFPSFYQEAFNNMRMAPGGIIPQATRVEMDRILRDLNIQTGYNRSDFFFPVGDAFWYRPSAIRPLIAWASEQGRLTSDTSAAISRTLAVVCSATGTKASAFASDDLLCRTFCAETAGNSKSAALEHALVLAQNEVNQMARSPEWRVARAGASLYVKAFPDGTVRRRLAGKSLRSGLTVARKARRIILTPKKEAARSIGQRIYAATLDRFSSARIKAQITRMNRFNAERPVFSVVIPVYNRTWQLELAIESILKQDFSNFELILVCDGSPQETMDILERYEKNPQVRIHKYSDNSGNACRGRNTGIQMARGTYIALMDSDDISVPSRLSTTLFHFMKQQADMVYGSVTIISDGARQIDGIWDGQFRKSFALSIEEMEEVNPAWTSTVSVRREVLLRYGAFRVAMRYREDQELWLRLAYNGCKLYHAEEMLAYYRFHAENAELLFKDNDDHWKKLMQVLYKTPYHG